MEEKFRQLFEQYYDRAYNVARGVVGRTDSAQDVVQQAFIDIFRHWNEYDPRRSFYTWLYQIVVNRSVDCLRRESARRRAKPEIHPPDTQLQRDVRECVDSLPEPYRSALILRDIDRFSCDEAAEIARCNSATFRWRVHQARKLFKNAWCPEPVPGL